MSKSCYFIFIYNIKEKKTMIMTTKNGTVDKLDFKYFESDIIFLLSDFNLNTKNINIDYYFDYVLSNKNIYDYLTHKLKQMTDYEIYNTNMYIVLNSLNTTHKDYNLYISLLKRDNKLKNLKEKINEKKILVKI